MKRALSIWLAFGALVFFCGTAGATSPAGSSGEETWDFYLSGAAKGRAYLTFRDNETVDGYMVVATNGKTKGSQGAFFVSGRWRYKQNGNVVGFLENSDSSDSVKMYITDLRGNVSTKGNRFILNGSTSFGKIMFTGVPAAEQQSLVENPFRDNWLITLKKYPEGQSFIEFVTSQEVSPNMYFFSGETAGSCLIGWALLSKGSNLAVAIGEKKADDCAMLSPEDFASLSDLNVALGKINLKTGLARLYGELEDVEKTGAPPPRDRMVLYIAD